MEFLAFKIRIHKAVFWYGSFNNLPLQDERVDKIKSKHILKQRTAL